MAGRLDWQWNWTRWPTIGNRMDGPSPRPHRIECVGTTALDRVRRTDHHSTARPLDARSDSLGSIGGSLEHWLDWVRWSARSSDSVPWVRLGGRAVHWIGPWCSVHLTQSDASSGCLWWTLRWSLHPRTSKGGLDRRRWMVPPRLHPACLAQAFIRCGLAVTPLDWVGARGFSLMDPLFVGQMRARSRVHSLCSV
jgi:hypothetical protein